MTMLANRLRKNLARLQPWARRERLGAWRLYDRDVPERPWMIDLYGDHVLASEYVTPVGHGRAEDAQADEQEDVIAAIHEVLGVPRERIHLKTRARHRSVERESVGDRSHELLVEERGHRFLVNLDDYLDTGLFIDHRDSRKRVGDASRDRRVLNLFCYTGAFTVYAAAGGAASTVSVDLSATYLAWVERNLTLNEAPLARHRLVRAEAFDFLRGGKETFDIIVLDPPTFSRAKQARSFHVQKDHAEIIRLAVSRLSPEGWLLFSTNYRQFALEEEALRGLHIRELTAEVTARDFRESLVRAWEIRAAP